MIKGLGFGVWGFGVWGFVPWLVDESVREDVRKNGRKFYNPDGIPMESSPVCQLNFLLGPIDLGIALFAISMSGTECLIPRVFRPRLVAL